MKWIKTGFGVFNLDQVTNFHISNNADIGDGTRWVNVEFCNSKYSNSTECSSISEMTVFEGDYDQCRTAIGQMLSGDFDMKTDYMYNLRSSRWVDINDHVFNLKHVTHLFLHCYDNVDNYCVNAYLPISVFRHKEKYETDYYLELKHGTLEECQQIIDDIVYGKYDIKGV